MGFFPELPSKQHEIEDHKEMLQIRLERIKKTFHLRHTMDKEARELLRWNVEQAQFHKHMIVQISILPDFNRFVL